MRCRWQRVHPPLLFVVCFACVYLTLELAARAGQSMFIGFDKLMLRYQVSAVGFCCVAYGLFRVLAFHPAWRTEYLKWLKYTPWKPGMPLPLGPIHLVWQDVAFVLLAEILLLHSGQVSAGLASVLFLVPYLICLTLSLFMTGQHRFGWAAMFGFGFAALSRNPLIAAIVLCAIYALAYVGLCRSMRSYPWPIEKPWTQLEVSTRATQPGLSWPYDRLGPEKLEPRINRETAMILCILPAWYLFVSMRTYGPPDKDDALLLLYACGVLSVAAMRWLVYRFGYAPPISLLGRIATMQLIIPRYDQIFLAPILSIVFAVSSLVVCEALGVSLGVSIPIVVAVTLFPALNCGPSLSKWRLTGAHRITTANNQTQFTQL